MRDKTPVLHAVTNITIHITTIVISAGRGNNTPLPSRRNNPRLVMQSNKSGISSIVKPENALSIISHESVFIPTQSVSIIITPNMLCSITTIINSNPKSNASTIGTQIIPKNINMARNIREIT